MQSQPASAAAKAGYGVRGRTFRRFCRRNSAGDPPQACPKLPYTLLPGSMAYPRFRPGPCFDWQRKTVAWGAEHRAKAVYAPSRKENAAPIPHIKKIPRRALCLGKDLFCLLRLFFSPLSAGYLSPLPLRPC